MDVEKKSLNSVLVRLECDELRNGSKLISTGLNGEKNHTIWESRAEVICDGSPNANIGDKIPIIVERPGE